MKPNIHNFDDLQSQFATLLKITLAIDISGDPEAMATFWPQTKSDQFRLPLLRTACDFWEREVRRSLGEQEPEYWFGIEGIFDSYSDPELGYSIYIELYAYCATKQIGDTAWDLFDNQELEDKCLALMLETTRRQGKIIQPQSDLVFEAEITEISEE